MTKGPRKWLSQLSLASMHKEREFILKLSAMGINNESVRDLLSTDSSPLRLLDDPEKGTVVEKLTEETLRDWNHFKELLTVCEAQWQIGETALNEVSSRSHQILILTVESTAREFFTNDKFSTLTATVNFIDLAGSERASQSLSAGTRLKEGCHINRSLLTLGTVMRKLSKGKTGHIPFRDSKLTRILQSSLGGNARTAIICTMSPARVHVEQSRNTLLFASCAKEVTTNAQVNLVMSDKALVKHLQRELAKLERELRSPGQPSVASGRHLNVRGKSATLPSITACSADISVIVKIERADSIKNLPSIISACHGTKVARGELGAELPIEEVPLLQVTRVTELFVRLLKFGKLFIHPVSFDVTKILDLLKSKLQSKAVLATRLRTRTFFRSRSSLTSSEDYTCITFHGPNPKTTHIFGNYIFDCDPKEM